MRITAAIRARFFLLTVILSLVIAGPSGAAEGPDALKILAGMETAYAGVNDYTAVFMKQERVKGELLPEETIELKFKKPFKVYMHWLKGTPHGGREALYVEGRYDDKVVGHEGGLLGIITLHMDPGGGTAMKGNRHPITDVGIGRLIAIVMENCRRGVRENEGRIGPVGEDNLFGRKVYRIKAELPAEKEKGYYARRIEIWVDRESDLPLKILIYGWEGELLESYAYKDLKLNPGTPGSEFDADFKGYGF